MYTNDKNTATMTTAMAVTLKVGSSTEMSKLVQAIAGNIRSGKTVNVDSMGPIATFIANKALVYAQAFLTPMRISLTPQLVNVSVENPTDDVAVKTAMRWVVTRI